MPKKRLLKEVHYICHDSYRVEDQGDNMFITCCWIMNPKHVRQGIVFALHESKAERSYRQGRVLKLIATKEERKPSGRLQRRVKLLVKETSAPLPWVGNGYGEKGFVWE